MPGCAVSTCVNYNRNTKGTNIRYHRFPKNPNILKQWIIACKRQDKINLKNACVCSIHFELSCYETTTFTLSQQLMNYTPKNNVKLKHDAVPSLNPPRTKALKRANLESDLAKRARIKSNDDSPVPDTFNITNEQSSNNGDVAHNLSSDKIAEVSSSEEINRQNIQFYQDTVGFRCEVKVQRTVSKFLVCTYYLKMVDCKPVSTPLDPNQKLTKDVEPKTDKERKEMCDVPHREAVGCLLYISQGTRLNICHAVGVVSQFCNAGSPH